MPLLLFLLFGFVVHTSGFSCKDQDGKDVDWLVFLYDTPQRVFRFAVYKMPIESDNSVPGVNSGIGWYYVDVNKKGALHPSAQNLNSKSQVRTPLGGDENGLLQAIAYTLQQYYDNQKDQTLFHVMYNDEPWTPQTGASSESFFSKTLKYFGITASVQKGHTKGWLLPLL